jgi:hypothetical protein
MFVVRKATLVVDRQEDLQAAGRLNMPAVTFEGLTEGRERAEGPFLIVSQIAPLEKLREIVARGISNADVRYVDLSREGSLSDMVAPGGLDRLRYMFRNPLGAMSDRVKLLSQWDRPESWEPYLTGDATFDSIIRWRPRNLAFFVGDYGSGKSTFAQLLALKLITGPTLWPQGARMSVCAWEDDQEDYRDRIYRYACGGDPTRPGVDPRDAIELESNRIFWFEPEADPERMLDAYLDSVEYLTIHERCRVHVADPWNSFSHIHDDETETKYVERMLTRMQELTRRLNTTILLVTHLPKSASPARGGIKSFSVGDAAGSKQWGNKADMGFCITRTNWMGSALNQHLGEEALKSMKLTPTHIEGARAAHPGNVSDEHLLMAIDKVKIEGMRDHSRQMGVKAIRAFSYSRETCTLTHEPAASEIGRLLWR